MSKRTGKNKVQNTPARRILRSADVRRFDVLPGDGLSTAQVKQRISEGLVNTPVDPPSKSVAEIIHSNVFTYFNYIFAGVTALLIIAGSFRDLTFLPIIIANTLIGIIQEIRSKKTLDKLNMLNAPKAKVIRDGKKSTIPAENLVLDDIVIFTAGAQIPADGTLVSGEVQVNESLITGESDEITKKPGDSLLSGSFIISGKCFARMDKVGRESYISRLTLQAKTVKEAESSKMMNSLKKLVKFAGIILVPIGVMLFIQQFFLNHASFRESIVSMVAAIIGMIPEGLYLLASAALVLSVMRLAKKKVLVHELACIETLARVDVLCVDKTGTITENRMETDGMITLPAYHPEKMPPLETMISDFVNSMSSDNITMVALQSFFNKPSGIRATAITPFSSSTKYSSVTFGNESFVIGAPEFVLREKYAAYQSKIDREADEGHRVLVFGRYHGTPVMGQPLSDKFDPYALLLMSNPIRKEAPETFSYFHKQGVEIKVISGDNPHTVSKVAMKAGIIGAENYIDARQLRTAEDFTRAVTRYTVFGRVTPNQKKFLVNALQAKGHTVAMTGDGVNDILALKEADCSIAMASGSDAAAQASQLVLLQNNFASLPSVVLEGRRVVNNIQRSASLFLVKNIFSLLMALFSIITFNSYPLTPSQISLVSMFTIGVPAFLLALESSKKRIEGDFLTNVLLKAIPGALTNFLVVGSMVVFGTVFEVDKVDVSTASALLLAVVGVMILYRISSPMNTFRLVVWIAMVIGMLGAIVFLNELFGISTVSLKCAMLLGAFTIITEPVFRYLSRIMEKVEQLSSTRRIQREKQKKYSAE
ncbi:MAG: cation-translocating P-type ATPase [Clostridiales bacterium]|nr:cation-translocating P-type ATPase [Clostridiales bacterium]